MLKMREMFGRRAKPKVVLESIVVSHYVEKVRWSLDRLGIEYEEKCTVGILGLLFTGRTVPQLRISQVPLLISNSSNVLRYLYGAYAHLPESEFLRPTPAQLALEEKFDRFGVSIQRILYTHLLSHPHLCTTLWGATSPHVPQWQRIAIQVLFPIVKMFLIRGLRLSPQAAERETDRACQLWDELEELLSDGREYIMGEELTFVDITFAALAAPLLMPSVPAYGGGVADEAMVDIPAELVQLIQRIQEGHPRVCAFVRKMYSEHRGKARGIRLQK